MKYTQEDYKEFLESEYSAQMKSYSRLIKTKAQVLKERGEVFVARFMKLSSEIAIFKIRVSDNLPRKNSFWTASVFSGDKGSFKNWEDLSWAELREHHQSVFSDSICVWLSKSDDPQFCLLGIKGLTIGFAKELEENKTVVAFGPKIPPTKYLLNLLDICRENSPITKELLEYNPVESSLWNPKFISSDQDMNLILTDVLSTSTCVVIQGPPGTGKTYRMARLASQLLKQNKSVLVTALTNRALMELASKDDLVSFLNDGRVSKTSLTIDEHRELPKLLNNEDNICNATLGHLSLATFYISSGWAKDVRDKLPFDYVIMDEASQALFPMIAAVKKLAPKVIWIGDQAQLDPTVSLNEDIVYDKEWTEIIHGFETLCENFSCPSYMLNDSFRLTERGAELTGIFYNGKLKSVSKIKKINSFVPEINEKGGATFIGLDLKWGDKKPISVLNRIFDIVQRILKENPKAEIAILSKFNETVNEIQKHFILNLNTEYLPSNLVIETVDKVQGLTVDYTIFFIPKASISYSVEKKLFNVATSRAKYNTIIVSDCLLLKENMDEQVRKYLLKSQDDKFVTFEEQNNVLKTDDFEIKIVNKIELSEKDKKRFFKNNSVNKTYIVDTNVFVNCPDIIAKIGLKNRVIVPAKVLEELDKLKLKVNVDKKNLNQAAKNISAAFIQKFSFMEEADVNLLPKGFDTKNPDCMILSVALKHLDENPILLTSDNMLQTRANGLGIKVLSLKEFLNNL